MPASQPATPEPGPSHTLKLRKLKVTGPHQQSSIIPFTIANTHYGKRGGRVLFVWALNLCDYVMWGGTHRPNDPGWWHRGRCRPVRCRHDHCLWSWRCLLPGMPSWERRWSERADSRVREGEERGREKLCRGSEKEVEVQQGGNMKGGEEEDYMRGREKEEGESEINTTLIQSRWPSRV